MKNIKKIMLVIMLAVICLGAASCQSGSFNDYDYSWDSWNNRFTVKVKGIDTESSPMLSNIIHVTHSEAITHFIGDDDYGEELYVYADSETDEIITCCGKTRRDGWHWVIYTDHPDYMDVTKTFVSGDRTLGVSTVTISNLPLREHTYYVINLEKLELYE